LRSVALRAPLDEELILGFAGLRGCAHFLGEKISLVRSDKPSSGLAAW
jgi:hypothetical protein